MDHIELSAMLALSSFGKLTQSPLALPQNALRLEALVNEFDDVEYPESMTWVLNLKKQDPKPGEREWQVVATVVAGYYTALRTFLCLDVVYRMMHRDPRGWRNRFDMQRTPCAVSIVCTPCGHDILEVFNGHAVPPATIERSLSYVQFVESGRPADNVYDYTQVDADLNDNISGTLYGSEFSPIIVVANSHTDDFTVMYGDALEFTHEDEDEIVAVAYKLYLHCRQEIDYEELASYFPRALKRRNSLTF